MKRAYVTPLMSNTLSHQPSLEDALSDIVVSDRLQNANRSKHAAIAALSDLALTDQPKSSTTDLITVEQTSTIFSANPNPKRPQEKLQDSLTTADTCWADAQCAPWTPAVQTVLQGKRYRTKVVFQNATFHFYHGCLMGLVKYQDRDKQDRTHLLPLPPLYWRQAEQQQSVELSCEMSPHTWEALFETLPRDILLFYACLMKQVFHGKPLYLPATGPYHQFGPRQFSLLCREVNWRHSSLDIPELPQSLRPPAESSRSLHPSDGKA